MTNKIAIITGGSRGIGKATALKLANNGINVIITYHSKATEAQEVVEAIKAKGVKATAFQLDSSNRESFMDIANKVQSALNEIGAHKFDFLVNNAGIGLTSPFAETSEEDFDILANIHLKSVYFITQKLLPLLNDSGEIVNISSGLTRIVYNDYALYASLKTAIETLTRYQAKELGARKIRVNVVAPGAIETDFRGGAVRDNAQMNAAIAGLTALGRVGQADDVAGAIANLLRDDSYWINAQRIEVSGGQAI
jgi:NAD(P)-dependent dehydrogenase (short-subunit alcohol dehydrogenase family)